MRGLYKKETSPYCIFTLYRFNSDVAPYSPLSPSDDARFPITVIVYLENMTCSNVPLTCKLLVPGGGLEPPRSAPKADVTTFIRSGRKLYIYISTRFLFFTIFIIAVLDTPYSDASIP